MMSAVLSILIFLPLVGAFFLLLVNGRGETIFRNARYVALFTSLITLCIALYVWSTFNINQPGFQFIENYLWIPYLDAHYHVGVDGISLCFVLLAALLVPICILISWDTVRYRVKEYYISFLVLETFMIGMFCALDFVLFYLFFEGVLIPMYLIIGIWGGRQRIYSAFKFFLYTLLGSVLMLVAILVIYNVNGTTSIIQALNTTFPASLQFWLWLAFFASFAVKVPMWPFHTWLPDAHVEAPTAGSIILAGVLLKMGGYGFVRFSIPMFPEATAYFTPFVYTLSVIAIIYTSVVALVQKDMKKLIAYSSVAHMGFVTLGLFSGTEQGIQGAIMQMVSHGLISAALFLCVGVVYERAHTKEIAFYGGLVQRMPFYAFFFLVFTMASIALPGTSGFVGEFLVLIGTFKVSSVFALLAATGMLLGAAYALSLYKRVLLGPLQNNKLQAIKDVNWKEAVAFSILSVFVLWLGIYPNSMFGLTKDSVQNVLKVYHPSTAHSSKAVEQAHMGKLSKYNDKEKS